jgi:hypothetical protein
MITPNRYTSGWESGCGPADPKLSSIATTDYTGTGGTGYGTSPRGTIGVGTPGSVPLAGFPAQVRFFIGPDNNLYVTSNQSAQTYQITGPVSNPPPGLGNVYSPTK